MRDALGAHLRGAGSGWLRRRELFGPICRARPAGRQAAITDRLCRRGMSAAPSHRRLLWQHAEPRCLSGGVPVRLGRRQLPRHRLPSGGAAPALLLQRLLTATGETSHRVRCNRHDGELAQLPLPRRTGPDVLAQRYWPRGTGPEVLAMTYWPSRTGPDLLAQRTCQPQRASARLFLWGWCRRSRSALTPWAGLPVPREQRIKQR